MLEKLASMTSKLSSEQTKKKLMTYTYHEYNIVPTIDVILLASGFFCLAKPKSAVKKKI